MRQKGKETYTAPPRQVVVIVSALVEGDEQVGALVAVGEREFGRAHLGSCCFCFRHTHHSSVHYFFLCFSLCVAFPAFLRFCSQAWLDFPKGGRQASLEVLLVF